MLVQVTPGNCCKRYYIFTKNDTPPISIVPVDYHDLYLMKCEIYSFNIGVIIQILTGQFTLYAKESFPKIYSLSLHLYISCDV